MGWKIGDKITVDPADNDLVLFQQGENTRNSTWARIRNFLLGDEVLKTSSQTIKGAINELNSQTSDIPNQTYITEKAKTVDVNNALALKSDKTTTDTLQAVKADTAYVDSKFGSMGSTKIFKGTCLFVNLPSTGMVVDEYWYVSDRSSNYCYNRTAWFDIGNFISLGDNTVKKYMFSDSVQNLISQTINNNRLTTINPMLKLGYVNAGVFSTNALYGACYEFTVTDDIVIKLAKNYHYHLYSFVDATTYNQQTNITGNTLYFNKYDARYIKYILVLFKASDTWGTIYNNTFLNEAKEDITVYHPSAIEWFIGGTTANPTFNIQNLTTTSYSISSSFAWHENAIIKNKRNDKYKVWLYSNNGVLPTLVAFGGNALGESLTLDETYIGKSLYLEVHRVDGVNITTEDLKEINSIISYEYSTSSDTVDKLSNMLNSLNGLTSDATKVSWISGSYLSNANPPALTVVANTQYCAPFLLKEGQTVELKSTGYLTNVCFIATCDSDGSNKVNRAISVNSLETTVKYTADMDRYVMMSCMNNTAPIVKIYREIKIDLNYLFSLFDNIICVGDSLTEGDTSGTAINRITKYNYPYYLEKITNASITNSGSSGITPIQYWNTIASGGQDANVTIGTGQVVHRFIPSSFVNYDTMLLFLGTNAGLTDTINIDCVGSDYTLFTDTNTGDYCKIIEKAKHDNPKINIILIKLYGGGGTIGVSATNTVIDKIAIKYGLKVIDPNIDQFNNTYDKLYHPNDVHMSNIGYMKFAKYIVDKMCEIASKNMNNYYIQQV